MTAHETPVRANRRAVISGAGLVTAAGAGMKAFGDALLAGASLAKPITHLDAATFPCAVACEVPGLDAKKLARVPKEAKVLARASVLALGALEDLLGAAPAPWTKEPWDAGFFLGVGLEQGDHRDLLAPLAATSRGRRLGLARLATSGLDAMNPLSSLKTLPNMALAHVGIKLGEAAPRGPNAAYSPFDSASLEAVAAAAEAVLGGECEVALAGGVDAPVSLFGLTTFARIRVPGLGTPLGEAAALFLVEEAQAAREAGRTALAEIEAFGSAADAAPIGVPSAQGFADAAGAAFAFAGQAARELDAVVVSGYASRSAPDLAGLEAVLGERLDPNGAIAPREVFGQCAAAGGALGVAAAVDALTRGRAHRVLVLAGAFGGSYTAMLLKKVRP